MTIAALFDMDNTLLRVDTGMSWTKFLYRRGELPPKMVAKAVYWSTLYKLAVLDMEAVFTKLCMDLEGDSEDEMIAKCDIWYREHIAR
ncbi:MAG: HAD family hydrolase, partial [Polyangiales bacterium]